MSEPAAPKPAAAAGAEDGACPYTALPDSAYWRRSVAAPAREEIDPVVAPRFSIARTDRLATAGSCFAQHISRYLARSGYNYFVPEKGHPMLGPDLRRRFNYGTFSARYGNIYTTRQLIQTLRRAYGELQPVDDAWEEADGSWTDPYRPHIQPGGFASRAEFDLDRAQHYAAIRAMVEKSDVFVFTLGLTECWLNAEDGMAYPLCPGCGAGRHDPARHLFHNLTVTEVQEDLQAAIAFMRARNPDLKVLLTVSPVPLVATYEPRHVLTATTYSKSVLRVAAQMVTEAEEGVDYFPSFEIITGNFSGGAYYREDLREVRPEGVHHAMRCFFRHYLGVELAAGQDQGDARARAGAGAQGQAGEQAPDQPRPSLAEDLSALVCDEEKMDL